VMVGILETIREDLTEMGLYDFGTSYNDDVLEGVRSISNTCEFENNEAGFRRAFGDLRNLVDDIRAGPERLGPMPEPIITNPQTATLKYSASGENAAKAEEYAVNHLFGPKTTDDDIKRVEIAMQEIAQAPLCRRENPDGVLSYLGMKDPKIQTHFVHREAWMGDLLKSRAAAEEFGLGYPKKSTPSGRPVYGYFDVPGLNKAEGYGAVELRFKESVKLRATMCLGDSELPFRSGKVVGTPVVDPKISGAGRNSLGVLTRRFDGYAEAQIQGGANLNEVGSFVIHRGNSRCSDPAYLASCEKVYTALKSRGYAVEYDDAPDVQGTAFADAYALAHEGAERPIMNDGAGGVIFEAEEAGMGVLSVVGHAPVILPMSAWMKWFSIINPGGEVWTREMLDVPLREGGPGSGSWGRKGRHASLDD